MSMIEIDPHLFIKCRLCLEESGMYQIVPGVRDQISFCFGINVEPFDGLPQLICKKCQLVLCEYSKTKTYFIQKQKDLKKRKSESNLTTTDVSRSKNNGASKRKHVNNYEVKTYTKIKKKRQLSPSLSEKSNSNHAAEDIRDTANEDENTNWKAKYQKTFTCTFCNITCSTGRSINFHQVIHKALKFKHVDIFNKYCVVEMPRIDDKPNLTGTTDKVVYSKNKIIAKNTADYYVAYKYKDSLYDENFKREENDNADEHSDSSFKSNKKVRRRRVRRLTSSSTETVVLDNNTNGLKTSNDCISINDSDSSDDKDETNEKRKSSLISHDTAKTTNMISKLISLSCIKYAKSHEVLDKSSLQQLNRKITSIGRQIINKQGFNTNRLMKYMEHLNLNIIWLARSPLSVTNNSNYLKIIPRTKYTSEKSSNDFEGYKKKYEKRNIQNREPEATLAQEKSKAESAGMAQLNKVNQGGNVSSIEKSESHVNELDPILLNENPVANPKQLKKLLSEAKKSKISSNSMPSLDVNPEELSSEVMTDYENNMPVITFTRSLATPDTNENSKNDNAESFNVSCNSENTIPEPLKTAPRIKVKSVSELMSKETLSRMKIPAVLSPNKDLNGAAQYTAPQSATVSSTGSAKKYVILDTVELPNTKTNSPFSYFRMLLQVHNLSLLDTDAIPTPDFHALIRFKVRYNYESKEKVELCLSLSCLNNMFLIRVRDRYDENNIDMSKISANWQWQILKIYKGEVVQKVLMNAEKTSPEVFTNTNRFICLLKSIKYMPK